MSETQVTTIKRSPTEYESEYIASVSRKLSKESGLSEDWIKQTLLLTIPDKELSRTDKNIFKNLYYFRPCLFEAMKSLPKDEVYDLFSGDLEQLKIQEKRFAEITTGIPLVSFRSLLPIAKEFRNFLKEETKPIVSEGEPSKDFLKSHYLESTFINRYYGKRRYIFSVEAPESDYLKRLDQFEDTAISTGFIKNELGSRYFHDQREFLEHHDLFDREGNGTLRTSLKRNLSVMLDRNYYPLWRVKQYLNDNKLKMPSDLDMRDEAFRMHLHNFSQKALDLFIETHESGQTSKLMMEVWKLVTSMPYEYLDLIFNGNLNCFGIKYEIEDKSLYEYGGELIEKILVAASIHTESARTSFLKNIITNLSPVIEDFQEAETKELKPITYSLYQAIYLCGHDSVMSSFGDLAQAKQKLHDLKESIKKGVEQTIDISYDQLLEINRKSVELEYMRVMSLDGKDQDFKTFHVVAENKRGFTELYEEYRPKNSAYPIFRFGSELKQNAVKALHQAYKTGQRGIIADDLIAKIYPQDQVHEKLKRKKNPWKVNDLFKPEEPVMKYAMIRRGEKINNKGTYILDLSFENKSPEDRLREIQEAKDKRKTTKKAPKAESKSPHPWGQSHQKPKTPPVAKRNFSDIYPDDDDGSGDEA